ncbi:hypothetical protein C100_18675 [Sphingobium sp. C100]|nr:hypothetical protein C100_18675 [Sphingobium sp. C100]
MPPAIVTASHNAAARLPIVMKGSTTTASNASRPAVPPIADASRIAVVTC